MRFQKDPGQHGKRTSTPLKLVMLRSEDSLAEPKVTILPPDSLKPSEVIGGSGCSAFGAVGAGVVTQGLLAPRHTENRLPKRQRIVAMIAMN